MGVNNEVGESWAMVDEPPTAESCPACDDDGRPCELCGPGPTEVTRLRALADWCDDPSASPAVSVNIGGRAYTPGYLLRRIADEYEVDDE